MRRPSEQGLLNTNMKLIKTMPIEPQSRSRCSSGMVFNSCRFVSVKRCSRRMAKRAKPLTRSHTRTYLSRRPQPVHGVLNHHGAPRLRTHPAHHLQVNVRKRLSPCHARRAHHHLALKLPQNPRLTNHHGTSKTHWNKKSSRGQFLQKKQIRASKLAPPRG